MAALGRLVGCAGALVLVSCTTLEPPAVPDQDLPPVPSLSDAPEKPPRPRRPEGTVLLGVTPRAPEFVTDVPPRVGPLDLDHWPFGWVQDPEGPRLGRSLRFWSDAKPLWNRALSSTQGQAVAALEAIYRGSYPAEESLRAAWRLWLVYSRAGLGSDARVWLDRVRALIPDAPLVLLETAWDQKVRLGDPDARLWWPPGGLVPPEASDRAKAALLRQKLFLGQKSLQAVGADDFVSTLVLDHDDLWVGTWNGAVVRWSLVTDEVTLMWRSDLVVPVTRLVSTRWFVYAFQERALLRYSKVTGNWRSFDYPPGWTGLRVTGAVASQDESLTVGYLGQGLWRWEKGEWMELDAAGGGPFVTALGASGDGWLVGTKDRGLWTYRDGQWAAVPSPDFGPSNISVLAPSDDGRWAVGTWGEGRWIYDGSVVKPLAGGREFVSAAAWNHDPVWGVLDQGLAWGDQSLGPRDGVGTDATGLVVWEGRWYWGTGEGVAWWSEYENPALHR